MSIITSRSIGLAAAIAAATLAGCAGIAEQDEIIANLIAAGYPEDDIMVHEGIVFVGRDAAVSLQASREMLEVPDGASHEQYRTTNLVSSAIELICVDGFVFTGRFSTAIDLAIANYNALNLRFRMERRARNASGCDAFIEGLMTSGTGGFSWFPSNGRPHHSISIGSGNTAFTTDVIEHIMTHELGHTIGLRHTDYFNRSISCGSGGNEGPAGVGAIHIPGTPTGAVFNGSLFNSCFHDAQTGEFVANDITALETLY